MANEKTKLNIHPLASGIAGAVVGAAATAAVMAMSDKKTREKVVGTFNNLKAQGQKKMGELTNQAKEVASKTQQEMKRGMKAEPISEASA